MSYDRGPYPDEHGFWRWQDSSGTFRRRFSDTTTAIVNYIPGSGSEGNVWGDSGWGYVILVAAVVVNGKYDVEWSAEDAMLAAIVKVENSR